jgi:hypothetical protein
MFEQRFRQDTPQKIGSSYFLPDYVAQPWRFAFHDLQNTFGYPCWLDPLLPVFLNRFSRALPPRIIITDRITGILNVVPELGLNEAWLHQGDPDLKWVDFMT